MYIIIIIIIEISKEEGLAPRTVRASTLTPHPFVFLALSKTKKNNKKMCAHSLTVPHNGENGRAELHGQIVCVCVCVHIFLYWSYSHGDNCHLSRCSISDIKSIEIALVWDH